VEIFDSSPNLGCSEFYECAWPMVHPCTILVPNYTNDIIFLVYAIIYIYMSSTLRTFPSCISKLHFLMGARKYLLYTSCEKMETQHKGIGVRPQKLHEQRVGSFLFFSKWCAIGCN
jgi:nicotinamide riboside transporter PnuC